MNNHLKKIKVNNILVINAGSSSIKFQLFTNQSSGLEVIIKGVVGGIGTKQGNFTYAHQKKQQVIKTAFPDHKTAIKTILDALLEIGVIQQLKDISAVGHRIVHGGSEFKEPIIVNQKILKRIDAIKDLAPLHIPANLLAIKEFMKQTDAPNIAVFDTAFHANIPLLNFIYPLPWNWYTEYGVRRYGFHGISYHYLLERVTKILATDNKKMNGIICHLGNGSSLSAIKKGIGFDTTMGLTPLAGLMMGTRSGYVDPSVFQYIQQQTGLSTNAITHQLNAQSGLLGISQISSDLKDIEEAATKGNKQAILAINLFVKRVVDYIAVYYNNLGAEIDYLVFSGGIGENSTLVISKIIEKLKSLPIDANWQLPKDRTWRKEKDYFMISNGKLKVLIILTNEELVICQSAIQLLKEKGI